MRFKNYFFSLFSFCLLLSVLPTLIIGSFSYKSSYDSMSENLETLYQQNLYKSMQWMDALVNSVNTASIQLLDLKDVAKSQTMTCSEKNFLEVKNLQVIINSIFSQIIDTNNVYLINNKENWIVSGTSFSKISELSNSEFLAKMLQLQEGKYLYDPPKQDKYQLGYNIIHNKKGILFVKKIPFIKSDNELMLAVVLTNNQIQRTLSVSDQSEKIVITDSNNDVLSCIDEDELGKDYSGKRDIILSSSNGSLAYYDDMLVIMDTDLRGWRYYYFTPSKTALASLKKINVMTLSIILIIIVCCILLAWIGVKKFYKPINMLLLCAKEKRKMQPLLKGFKEFVTIEEKLNEIINQNSNYEDKVELQTKYVNDYFLKKIILGEISDDFQNRYLTEISLMNESNFCVLAIDIDSINPGYFKEHDQHLVLFAMGNILHEIFDRRDFEYVTMIDGRYFILLTGSDNENLFKIKLESQANAVIHAFKEYLGVVVAIGVGLIYHNLTDVHHSMVESLKAIKYRRAHEDGIILFYKETTDAADMPFVASNDEKVRILAMLRLHDCQNVTALLDEFIDLLYRACRDHESFQMEIVELFIEIYKIVNTKCDLFANKVSLQTSFVEELIKINTIDKIKSFFRLHLIMPYEESIQNNSGSSFKMELERYIYKNISNYISLESCAQHFNYSPGYLSKLIKQHLGTSFSEYTGELKIEIAKKLLSETTMSIQDIAAKLSYNNSQNFIRSFKKITCITPGKYREINLGS